MSNLKIFVDKPQVDPQKPENFGEYLEIEEPVTPESPPKNLRKSRNRRAPDRLGF